MSANGRISGRAIVEWHPKWVSICCNLGHVITTVTLDKTFGGSAAQVDLTAHSLGQGNRFDRESLRCGGFGHEPAEFEQLLSKHRTAMNYRLDI